MSKPGPKKSQYASTDYDPSQDSGLDPGIKPYVEVLLEAGIETFESCQGGEGHGFPEPTICFAGLKDEGWRALAAALCADLPVWELRRVWTMVDGEPTGPEWEMVFIHPWEGSTDQEER